MSGVDPIAIPAYQDYTIRSNFMVAINYSQQARNKLGSYYLSSKQVPQSLAIIGVDENGPNGLTLSVDPKGMVLTVKTTRGSLIFIPSMGDNGQIVWRCKGGSDTKPGQLPQACR